MKHKNTSIKSSRTANRVSCGQKTSAPFISLMLIITLIMETELVSETSGSCPQLTLLVAWGGFVDFISTEASDLI